MTATFRAVFGPGKPVIAMVHLGALPGTPLYDAERGIEGSSKPPPGISRRCRPRGSTR